MLERSETSKSKYDRIFVVAEVLDHDRFVVVYFKAARREKRTYTDVCSSRTLKWFNIVVSAGSDFS